jgi:hypothetical protein
MKTKLIKFISVLFIITWPVILQSQTINTTAGTVSSCPGEIVVPVIVTNCNDVGAISLVLQFNTSVLTFLNYENLNPQISSGYLIVNNSDDKVIISWANTAAANIGDGTLMDLRFSGITGNSSLTWDIQTSGNCEYSNVNGTILPSSYINGSVTVYQVPLITTQPMNKSVLEYQNATYHLDAIATGIQYQWFASYNNGADWVELSNNSLYAGVTTATLTIYNTQLTYDGFLYRCEVSGSCTPVVVSDPAMLTIIEPLISSFDVESVCPGTIAIPICTSNFNDVAAFSLAFNYNNAVLSFEGYQGLNSILPSGNFVCNAIGDKVYLSWSSTMPVTFSLPDTVLVEILFSGATGSSNLNWDTQTAGNCEYTYLSGDEIVSVFQNNSFTLYQIPQINGQPVDKIIPENTATSYSVSAIASGINYQWEVSIDEGDTWIELNNGGFYSGVTSSTLNISNASLGMSGFWYRCVVGGYCSPEVYSNPAELLVLPRITAIAGTISDCPGTITVPIDVTHFINVAALSLTLNFDDAILNFDNYQSLNDVLIGSDFTLNAVDGKVYITWSSTTPVTIGDDLLLELVFNGITGSSSLNWNNSVEGACEFSDLEGNIIFDNYVNGNVTVYQPPLITGDPSNQTSAEGTSTSFTVTATGTGLAYQWQESEDNGNSWNNLTNTAPYSGVNNATLQINPVNQAMNGFQYRCRVSGTCLPLAYSGSAILNVLPPIIYTSAGDITNSCTGNIVVPIMVSNCNDVSAISLVLNYDNSKLTYEGYSSPNSSLSGGMLVVNATSSQIIFSWISMDPVNLGFDKLIEYQFKANPGITTTLEWDTQTQGNCEYSDPDGNLFIISLSNGDISIAANALVVDAGNDESITPGASVQLNGAASGGSPPYIAEWTPSNWLSDPNILTPLANPPGTTSYTLTVTDDLGCSGTDNMIVNVITAGIDLNVKAFLQGSFIGSEMGTLLNSSNLLPADHPYSGSPWNYIGDDHVTSIPNTEISDWILVELRETDGGPSSATSETMIAQKAGFILNNGNIVATDGSNLMHFDVSITQDLYVVILHRNHLSIMSSGPLTAAGTNYIWDFTTGQGQAYGSNSQIDLGGGLYGMIAGDGDANGTVELADKNNIWSLQVGRKAYLAGDYNMNGQVTNLDKNDFWLNNLSESTQMPE